MEFKTDEDVATEVVEFEETPEVVVTSVLWAVVVVTTTSEVVVAVLEDWVVSNTEEEEAPALVVATVLVASVVWTVVVSDDVLSAPVVVVVATRVDVVVSAVVLATPELVSDGHGPQVFLFCSLSGLAWDKAKEAARTTRDLKCIFANVKAVQRFWFSFGLVINNWYRTGKIVIANSIRVLSKERV